MQPRFLFLGTPITLRPLALGAGILSAIIVGLLTRDRRLAAAAGALWYSADLTHVAGHILSSRAVGAPMDGIDFGVYPMSVYANHDVTPQQHIGRAAGGVLASLIAILLLLLLSRKVSNPDLQQLLRIATAQHGFILAASLLPIKFVDGGVIYANLAKLAKLKQG